MLVLSHYFIASAADMIKEAISECCMPWAAWGKDYPNKFDNSDQTLYEMLS